MEFFSIIHFYGIRQAKFSLSLREASENRWDAESGGLEKEQMKNDSKRQVDSFGAVEKKGLLLFLTDWNCVEELLRAD